MKFTESMLDTYAAPLSDSEDKRCQHVIGMIRDALKNIGYSEGTRGSKECYPRLILIGWKCPAQVQVGMLPFWYKGRMQTTGF